jgi:flagellar basal body-associated protein FliL
VERDEHIQVITIGIELAVAMEELLEKVDEYSVLIMQQYMLIMEMNVL